MIVDRSGYREKLSIWVWVLINGHTIRGIIRQVEGRTILYLILHTLPLSLSLGLLEETKKGFRSI